MDPFILSSLIYIPSRFLLPRCSRRADLPSLTAEIRSWGSQAAWQIGWNRIFIVDWSFWQLVDPLRTKQGPATEVACSPIDGLDVNSSRLAIFRC